MKLRLFIAVCLLCLAPRYAWAAQAVSVARARLVATRDVVRVPLADQIPASDTPERHSAPPHGEPAVGVVLAAPAQQHLTLNFE